MYHLINKLETRDSLLDKNSDRKQTVLTEDTLDNTDARLETSPRKWLKELAQDTYFDNNCMKGQNLLKPYNTLVHTLKEHDLIMRINFCNWFLWSVHDGKADPN
jgi:hypothetical protein